MIIYLLYISPIFGYLDEKTRNLRILIIGVIFYIIIQLLIHSEFGKNMDENYKQYLLYLSIFDAALFKFVTFFKNIGTDNNKPEIKNNVDTFETLIANETLIIPSIEPIEQILPNIETGKTNVELPINNENNENNVNDVNNVNNVNHDNVIYFNNESHDTKSKKSDDEIPIY